MYDVHRPLFVGETIGSIIAMNDNKNTMLPKCTSCNFLSTTMKRPIEMNIKDKRDVVAVIDAIFLGHLDFLF